MTLLNYRSNALNVLKYVALLGNVDKTILRLSLGDGFFIEEWRIEDFVEFYEQLIGAADHDIWFKLDEDWGYGHGRKYRPKYVYVVRKDFVSPPSYDFRDDQEEWNVSFRMRRAFESQQEVLLQDKILKLRLCAEGSIKICVETFYIDTVDGPEMNSSSEEMLHCENRLYKVRTKDIHFIQTLLRGQS